MLLQFLGDQLRQGVDAVHAEDQVDIGVALAQLFHNMLLLGHAAADADHQPRVFFLKLFERPHIAEYALLGMLTYGAGIKKDQISLLDRIAQAVAHILQNALDLFTVIDILLASVTPSIYEGRMVVIPVSYTHLTLPTIA